LLETKQNNTTLTIIQNSLFIYTSQNIIITIIIKHEFLFHKKKNYFKNYSKIKIKYKIQNKNEKEI